MQVYCANEICEAIASKVVKRSGTPLCRCCLEVYRWGQSNPDGELVEISEFVGDLSDGTTAAYSLVTRTAGELEEYDLPADTAIVKRGDRVLLDIYPNNLGQRSALVVGTNYYLELLPTEYAFTLPEAEGEIA